MQRFVFKKKYESGNSSKASDFIVQHTELSKQKVKDAMLKGAVWLERNEGKRMRIRRATTLLQAGDTVELYYDEHLLACKAPEGGCIHQQKEYSVWFKPAGLLTQGTLYGDHCALARAAEILFENKRPCYVVHRLDREASGLVMIAHTREGAARLSKLFQNQEITKSYHVEVLGDLAGSQGQKCGKITQPLNGKTAITEYTVDSYDCERNISHVTVYIKTGRLHQIRRHFTMAGFPVMGDPRYGKGNKNTEGLRLKAVTLSFVCPFRNKKVSFSIE